MGGGRGCRCRHIGAHGPLSKLSGCAAAWVSNDGSSSREQLPPRSVRCGPGSLAPARWRVREISAPSPAPSLLSTNSKRLASKSPPPPLLLDAPSMLRSRASERPKEDLPCVRRCCIRSPLREHVSERSLSRQSSNIQRPRMHARALCLSLVNARLRR